MTDIVSQIRRSQMIKGYYLVYDTLNLDKPDGVEKKIISQRNMFKENGFDM